MAALYRKFVGNAALFIGELATQDAVARVETLHTLKGSAAMMGASRLAAEAAAWEVGAQQSVQVEQAMTQLNAELAKFRVAAAERLRELGVSLEP
ncbi:Hpt domain-containing protein [Steroidobacter sp.]|uniref:Hpt domain-containing protein n=1 Tax=Steroidobacter sp. TaxID=1978227 RepID=UPI001A3BE7C0|nr:Hpt domain-containing protein [Steroidobacter sp.]MBL8268841.1 Hpt domain-containing protein [Steroidobacter sp.]